MQQHNWIPIYSIEGPVRGKYCSRCGVSDDQVETNSPCLKIDYSYLANGVVHLYDQAALEAMDKHEAELSGLTYAGWYFWDEGAHGPFDTFEEAQKALVTYLNGLEEPQAMKPKRKMDWFLTALIALTIAIVLAVLWLLRFGGESGTPLLSR